MPRASTRETPIKDRCLRYLRQLSHSKWLKTHGSQYAVIGTPDIIGCYKGQTFLFEVKREGHVASERQEEEIRQWRLAGAVVWVAYCPADCRDVLEPWLTLADKEIQP